MHDTLISPAAARTPSSCPLISLSISLNTRLNTPSSSSLILDLKHMMLLSEIQIFPLQANVRDISCAGEWNWKFVLLWIFVRIETSLDVSVEITHQVRSSVWC